MPRTDTMPRLTIGDVFFRNRDFETAPAFTAATTANNRFIDGTAAGSVSNSYGYGINKSGTTAAQFDTAEKYSGASSMKLSLTGTGSLLEVQAWYGGMSAINLKGQSAQISPSTAYTFTFYMKTNYVSGDSNDGALGGVQQLNKDGSVLTTNATSPVKTTTGWTLYTVSFTSNSAAAYFTPYMRIYGQTGAGTLIMDAWYDNMSLKLTTPPSRSAA